MSQKNNNAPKNAPTSGPAIRDTPVNFDCTVCSKRVGKGQTIRDGGVHHQCGCHSHFACINSLGVIGFPVGMKSEDMNLCPHHGNGKRSNMEAPELMMVHGFEPIAELYAYAVGESNSVE